jgi:hypothetical protein
MNRFLVSARSGHPPPDPLLADVAKLFGAPFPPVFDLIAKSTTGSRDSGASNLAHAAAVAIAMWGHVDHIELRQHGISHWFTSPYDLLQCRTKQGIAYSGSLGVDELYLVTAVSHDYIEDGTTPREMKVRRDALFRTLRPYDVSFAERVVAAAEVLTNPYGKAIKFASLKFESGATTYEHLCAIVRSLEKLRRELNRGDENARLIRAIDALLTSITHVQSQLNDHTVGLPDMSIPELILKHLKRQAYYLYLLEMLSDAERRWGDPTSDLSLLVKLADMNHNLGSVNHSSIRQIRATLWKAAMVARMISNERISFNIPDDLPYGPGLYSNAHNIPGWVDLLDAKSRQHHSNGIKREADLFHQLAVELRYRILMTLKTLIHIHTKSSTDDVKAEMLEFLIPSERDYQEAYGIASLSDLSRIPSPYGHLWYSDPTSHHSSSLRRTG